jgi:hypothetical protein
MDWRTGTAVDGRARWVTLLRGGLAAAVVAALALAVVVSRASEGSASLSATSGSAGYTGVAPFRLLDTRIGLGAPRAAIGPGGGIDVQITGVGGLPATGIGAVVLNVTATEPTSAGFLTVYPSGAALPMASNLNMVPGLTVANVVIATIGAGGKIRIFNNAGYTQVIADVSGWFADGSYYHALTPSRLLDTRTGLGSPVGPLGQGQKLDLQVAGRGGVPASGAVAVALNLTGTGATTSTYITMYPGPDLPTASNLNLVPGQTAAVQVVEKVGAAGLVSLYNNGGSTHLIVDVAGWFAANGQYTPLTPARVLDTRNGPFVGGIGASAAILVTGCVGMSIGVPKGASSVVLSVTAVSARVPGFLTVYPSGGQLPNSSNLNFTAGATVSNLVITKVGPDGYIVLHNANDYTDVIVDVLGWFSADNDPAFNNRAVTAWGVGFHGELGDATTPTTPSAPVRVAGLSGVTSVAGGYSTTYAVKPDGTAWVWGTGDFGELGNGVYGTRECSPVQIPGLSNVVSVAAGGWTGYAVKKDGSAWAWGRGDSGQLGSAGPNSATPTQISGLSGIVAVASRLYTTYAVKADGTVWAWGRGTLGQLGNGTTTAVNPTPVQVTGLTGVTAIASGNGTGYALKNDGTVWSWGYNHSGELGNGSTANTNTPVQVTGLAGVTAIAAGANNGYALKADGTVWAWGAGNHGQLGDGTTTPAGVTAVRVGLPSGIIGIGSARFTGYAFDASGAVWGWGDGDQGQLGPTTTVFATNPLRVADVPSVVAVTGGGYASYAITNGS